MHGLTNPKFIPLSFSVEVLNSLSTYRPLQIITIFCLQMQCHIPKERNSQLNCHENFRSRQIYSNFNQMGVFLRNSLFSLRGNQKFRRTQRGEHCSVGTALLRNEHRQLSPVFQILHSVREDTPEYNIGDPINKICLTTLSHPPSLSTSNISYTPSLWRLWHDSMREWRHNVQVYKSCVSVSALQQ
jgi:hypothetical protein